LKKLSTYNETYCKKSTSPTFANFVSVSTVFLPEKGAREFEMLGLETFPLSVNLVIFGISAIIVWIAGKAIAIISECV
jgi:hypothetical protein